MVIALVNESRRERERERERGKGELLASALASGDAREKHVSSVEEAFDGIFFLLFFFFSSTREIFLEDSPF